MSIPIKIRTAVKEDVSRIESLRKQIYKSSRSEEIAIWMEHDPMGIKIAEMEKGDIIGACNAIAQNGNFCFLGSYFVEEKFRKLGIGKQLWDSCEEYIGSRPAVLSCTPDKTDLYMKRGFQIKEENWTISFYYTEEIIEPSVLSKDLPSGVVIHSFQESYLSLIHQYDNELVGFNRNLALNQICREFVGSRTFVALSDHKCVGFGVLRLTFRGVRCVGPLYANDPMTAEALLRTLIDAFPNSKGLSMFCVSKNEPANDLLKKLKCLNIQKYVRLYRKEKVNNVDIRKIYALVNNSFTLF